MTVNKVVDGKCVKYDTYSTEAEADVRIVELHAMGKPYDKAYKINCETNKSSTHGVHPYARPTRVTCDETKKSVTFDDDGIITDIFNEEMDRDVRPKRNELLVESDIAITMDRWDGMSDAKKTEWTTYRQTLRDLPENTSDPINPVWPVKPKE